MSKRKTADIAEDFWPRVDVRGLTECWPWTEGTDAQGRGRYTPSVATGQADTIVACRVAWQVKHKREIPPGWDCRQRCHNFLCSNPAHLFIVEPVRRYLSDPAAPGTFAADIEEFLQWLAFQGYAGLTIPAYAAALGKLATWLGSNAPDVRRIHQVQRAHIRAFAFWLQEQPGEKGQAISRETRAKAMYALRSMFKYYATETDLAVLNPQAIKPPRMVSASDRVPRAVATPEQVDQLIAGCQDGTPIGRRDAAIFALLFSTGLRIHEVGNLDRSVFPRENLGREPTYRITVKGKGGHVRLCFVDERAQATILAMLRDRLDGERALFVNFRPGRVVGGRTSLGPERLSHRGIQLMFKARAIKAGLGGLDLTPHSMRHGLAVDLLKGGADLRTVQDVLGHQSIVTTQIYTKLTNEHLEEGYMRRKSLRKAASA